MIWVLVQSLHVVSCGVCHRMFRKQKKVKSCLIGCLVAPCFIRCISCQCLIRKGSSMWRRLSMLGGAACLSGGVMCCLITTQSKVVRASRFLPPPLSPVLSYLFVSRLFVLSGLGLGPAHFFCYVSF
jgi:hypothetical protein